MDMNTKATYELPPSIANIAKQCEGGLSVLTFFTSSQVSELLCEIAYLGNIVVAHLDENDDEGLAHKILDKNFHEPHTDGVLARRDKNYKPTPLEEMALFVLCTEWDYGYEGDVCHNKP